MIRGPNRVGSSRMTEGVHHKTAQGVDENSLPGALGGVEVGGDHGVQRHDDKAPRVLRERPDRELQRLGVCAEQAADAAAAQAEQQRDECAADQADRHAGAEVEFQIVLLLCTIALAEQGLKALGRAIENGHGEGGDIADHTKGVDAHTAHLSHERPVCPERGHRGGKLGDGLRGAAQQDLAAQRPAGAETAKAQAALAAQKVGQADEHGDALGDAGGPCSAPASPMRRGNTNSQSPMMFRIVPAMTAPLTSRGEPSLRAKPFSA